MEKNKLQVAVIQETKLTTVSKPKDIKNFTFIRKDRGRDKGGGLAFLVHEDLTFNQEVSPPILENDPHVEVMTISILSQKDKLMIRNIYIPPTSSCTSQYDPPLDHLFDGLNNTSLILGDINAHHQSWYSPANEDNRGKNLADTLTRVNFGFLNEDLPTRITPTCTSAPDISLASPSLLPTASWKPETKLSSDHLPIIISIPIEVKKTKSANRTFINFRKADWKGFRNYTESIFSRAEEVTDVHKSEKYFRSVVQRAAKKFIPTGRILRTYNSVSSETAKLISERDKIRQENPSDPRLKDLNKNISDQIKEHRRIRWREHLDKNCEPGSKNLWTTIKNLNNPTSQPKNQGIKFNDKILNDPKKIAEKFNAQYTPCSDSKPDKGSRPTVRNLKKPSKDPCIVITPKQTADAIRRSKSSKALGPDNISPIMLKNLGPNGIQVLTNIFNLSVNTSIIPSIWKIGRIIPLLKPGKAADLGPSYRPISLLSPAAKILEAILLPQVSEAIDLQHHQHGFRKNRSTTTALHDISNYITKGLNKKQPVDRTVSVAIDLSRAFDTVDHNILLKDIDQLQHLNDHVKRYLCAYIRGRWTYVEFRGVKSKCRKMKQGVPQGGVLSPLLFNLYMSKMPQPTGSVKLVTYADDSNVLNSGQHIEPICKEINTYLNILDDWFKSRNLFISPAKSTATLFTTDPGEVKTKLPITVKNDPVPTVQHPVFLGITFDNLFTFRHHAKSLRTKLLKKNNILKALTGTSWGKEKEVISTTYKAISQSLINYACPIWTPNLSKTNWDSLQTCQNSALKIATGCLKIASTDHVHAETKIMPVQQHCEMLSQQYLLSTQLESHPVREDLTRPQPARRTKHTLVTKFGRRIKRLAPSDEILTNDHYKAKLKRIHTDSVRDVIDIQAVNPVLNTKAPEIHPSERWLPRKTRATLSQLRSGHSTHLNSYLSRLDQQISDRCPDCNVRGHTTKHLFRCKNRPTHLTVQSLWKQPADAAQFLGLPQAEIFDDHG